jgi:tetratricopeptide (TPR) repeat protein
VAKSGTPATAKEAVERGLQAFQASRVDDAIDLFNQAIALTPNREEAMAAHYNLGCAYTKNRRYDLAADSIMRAVNDYDMKLLVALKVHAHVDSHTGVHFIPAGTNTCRIQT